MYRKLVGWCPSRRLPEAAQPQPQYDRDKVHKASFQEYPRLDLANLLKRRAESGSCHYDVPQITSLYRTHPCM